MVAYSSTITIKYDSSNVLILAYKESPNMPMVQVTYSSPIQLMKSTTVLRV